MRRQKRPNTYQLKAFLKKAKSAYYEAYEGSLVNGVFIPDKKYSSLRWKHHFKQFNNFLRKNNYVHTEVQDAKGTFHRFLLYRGSHAPITPHMLQNISSHHREIGLAIGIPEFAVNDFLNGKLENANYTVKIKRLGLAFTMSRNDSRLKSLEAFLAKNNLEMKDAQITPGGLES